MTPDEHVTYYPGALLMVAVSGFIMGLLCAWLIRLAIGLLKWMVS